MGGRGMVGMGGAILAAVSWLVWMCPPVQAAQAEPSQQISDTSEPVDAVVPASTPTAKPRVVAPSMEMASSSEQEASPSEHNGSAPMRISMEFQDANLKDVLKLFSQQTGVNVIAGEGVGDQPVTLYLEDVTAMDMLDQLLRAANLMVERVPESEIYLVKPKLQTTEESTTTRTIARAYHLKYARVSDSALAKAGAGAAIAGEALGIGASGSSGGASSAGAGKGIDDVISRLLTSAGTLVVDGRTNSLLITDLPENFPRLEAAITALDVRTPQIMIEAEVIETSLSKAKELGLKWGSGTSGGDLASLALGARQTRFPWNWIDGGRYATNQDDDGNPFPLSTLSFASARGLLQAVESDSDTKILARPRVLTLDNESAVIRLTADEVIGFTVTTGEATQTTSSEPERQTTGVVLTVTPQVNAHGYVTMLVQPSVTKTVPSKVTPPSGQSTPRDPKSRSARAVVRIRSGDTLVIGGLIDHDDEQTKTNTPILSGVPFIGELFKHSHIKNVGSELMVFVTPRIIEEPSEEKLAANRATSMGLREQEPAGARQETMEQSLNVLEQQRKL